MAQKKPTYVQAYVSDGKRFFYVRRGTKRMRLPGDPTLPEHAPAYAEALDAVGVKPKESRPKSWANDAIHLYVIQAEHGPFKVGRSNDPEARMALLQAGSAERLAIVKVFPWRGDEEKAVHKALKAHRMMREWFSGDRDSVLALKAYLGPMTFPFVNRRPQIDLAAEKARYTASALLWSL